MSSVTEIESAIDSLPREEREALLLRIAEKWEDYQDMQAAIESLSEGVFLPLQDVLKKCDAIHGFSEQQG